MTLAEIPEPGLYQVTLSGAGWTDVIQNGSVMATQAHTGNRDCPSIRKSVRFRLASGRSTLQFSSVPIATIKFAIRRAD